MFKNINQSILITEVIARKKINFLDSQKNNCKNKNYKSKYRRKMKKCFA